MNFAPTNGGRTKALPYKAAAGECEIPPRDVEGAVPYTHAGGVREIPQKGRRVAILYTTFVRWRGSEE